MCEIQVSIHGYGHFCQNHRENPSLKHDEETEPTEGKAEDEQTG